MATETVPQAPETFRHDIYEIPTTVPREVYDRLSNRITQLNAALALICGQGFESFAACGDNIQQNYLWGCEEAAEECEKLVDALGSAVYRPELTKEASHG
jgi:hypothetical protein